MYVSLCKLNTCFGMFLIIIIHNWSLDTKDSKVSSDLTQSISGAMTIGSTGVVLGDHVVYMYVVYI